MAVHSKADKTGGHKVKPLALPGVATNGAALSKPAFGAISLAGQKALTLRARHGLTQIESPSQPLTE